MRVLGISGSLRRDSHNRRLLLEAAELCPAGVELELYDGLKALPPYDEDDDGERGRPGGRAAARRDRRRRRDPDRDAGVQLVGPGPAEERDRLGLAPARRRRAAGKPVAVIGASTGSFGGVWAQAELKDPGHGRRARRRGELAVPRAHVRLAEDGRLLRRRARERLDALVDALLAEIRPRAARRPRSARASRSAQTIASRARIAVARQAPLADRVDHGDLDHDQVDAEREPGEDDRRADRGRLDPGRKRGHEDRDVRDSPSTATGIPATLAYFECCTVSQPPVVHASRMPRVARVDEVGGDGGAGEREHGDRAAQCPVGHFRQRVERRAERVGVRDVRLIG